jgi:L-proline---[L-prolyl-carrier protein] ligase
MEPRTYVAAGPHDVDFSMATPEQLHDLVLRSAQRTPESLAVSGPEGDWTYGELDACCNRIGRALRTMGIQPGDRVAVWLDKSVGAVAAIQASLRVGAAYVPIDPLNPWPRALAILRDCQASIVVTSFERAGAVESDGPSGVRVLPLDGLAPALTSELASFSSEPMEAISSSHDQPAYVLYTSGSTGAPKGVSLSHGNALSFVEWASTKMAVRPVDRLANQAPLHFDLSVLDLYGAFRAGASVHLVPDAAQFSARALVRFLLSHAITIWYSVPSVLVRMMAQGGLLDMEPASLRAILFAGEPFPLESLNLLCSRWPHLRYLNLYGPTESNVCTFYEFTEVEKSLGIKSTPIGRACAGHQIWAVRDDGEVVRPGESGELIVEGPGVMLGYWGHGRLLEPRFATGDIVRLRPDGNFLLLGRRDEMVKVRGQRIELGEIEEALRAHPSIQDVAVVVSGTGLNARLVAFVIGRAEARPGLIELKKHSSSLLPRHMIIDRLFHVSEIPRTRNDKVDRVRLRSWAEAPFPADVIDR